MATYRPITFTPYDPEIHTSVSKTVFTGIKISTDNVDDFVLRGTPAPSKLVHWGSPDLSFSVSEITQDDGEVVHQIGLATGELYAMARDGLFINSNDFGESFFTDQMFVDITAPTLGESSRLYEMTVDNTDLQQETIYLYSIAGDELSDGNTPSAQEMINFVADVETNGTYALADLQRATPSEAPLATTTVITDMPGNNYEWADEYYDYLWNPLDDDRVSNGSVNLTISASNLLAGDTWAVFPPTNLTPDGDLEITADYRLDSWVDTNSDDLFIQFFDLNNSVAGTLRILDWKTSFPAVSQVSDYWDLAYHPLQTVDFLTELGIISSTVEMFPYSDASQLPEPEPFEDERGYYFFASFRNMSNFDSSTGTATFANESRTYTGGAFDSNFQSEPGDTTYINSGTYDRDKFWPSDISYNNAPDSIEVDFRLDKVTADGWGFSDDFSGFHDHYIDGSLYADEFKHLDHESSLHGRGGDDWIHSFQEGGAWMQLGAGSDFVNASSITSNSPNAGWSVNVVVESDDVWDSGYYAFNASDANHVGTGDLVSLDGYRQIQDVVFGSAEGYVKVEVENAYSFANDDDKGIALFVDDMLTARHVESGQASETRLKDIAEIHTTVLDDIIDLTSSYHADQTGNVKVYGLAGDDILWGGSSNETLDGGHGADLINGGAGNDTLTGGSGADIFEFTATSGNDTVTDFSETDQDRFKFYVGQNDSTSWSLINNTVVWGDVSVELVGYSGTQSSLANFLDFVDLDTKQAIEMDVTVAGTVIYGSPISGAKVYLDYDDDGLQDNHEPWALTDNMGQFELESDGNQFTIRASADNNTIATTTGQAVDFELEATPGFSVVSVFSSVLANGDLTSDELLEVLGLNTALDLASANPWSQQANNSSDLIDLAKKESQINAILGSLQQLIDANNPSESDVFSDILNGIGDAFAEVSSGGSTVDLSNGDFINGVLAELSNKYTISSQTASAVVQTITTINASIESPSEISDLSSIATAVEIV